MVVNFIQLQEGKMDSLKVLDSLKVSGISTGLGLVYYTDIISGILMCLMFSINIYYIWLKTKKIKDI